MKATINLMTLLPETKSAEFDDSSTGPSPGSLLTTNLDASVRTYVLWVFLAALSTLATLVRDMT